MFIGSMVFLASLCRLYPFHGRLNNLQISMRKNLKLSKRGYRHCNFLGRSHELLACLYVFSFNFIMPPGSLKRPTVSRCLFTTV
jgi:hypothetical protein